jgi:hypothetical protein
MLLPMADAAITPTVPDTGGDPEFRPTLRERLGIALFLVSAVVATAAWVGLLVWGVLALVKSF